MKPNVALALEDSSAAADLARRLGRVATVCTIEADSFKAITRGVIQSSPKVMVLELSEIRELAIPIISLIKAASPGTSIIAYSPEPSDDDAQVVEEGIYYYAGGTSVERLEEIVRAALRTRVEGDRSLLDPPREEMAQEPSARIEEGKEG